MARAIRAQKQTGVKRALYEKKDSRGAGCGAAGVTSGGLFPREVGGGGGSGAVFAHHRDRAGSDGGYGGGYAGERPAVFLLGLLCVQLSGVFHSQ